MIASSTISVLSAYNHLELSTQRIRKGHDFKNNYLMKLIKHKSNLDQKQEQDPLYDFSKEVKGSHKL